MNDDIVAGFDDERDDSLKIRLQKIGDTPGCLVLYLTGYIDTYNSIAFQKRVDQAIAAGFVRLIFNFGSLTYLSSTAIGAFTALLKEVRRRGGDVVLFEIQPRVYEVLQLLGFSQFFNIVESLDQAITRFAPRGEGEKGTVFPKIFMCPICSRRLRAPKAGRFRCSECKTILVLTEAGAIELG